MESVIEWLLVFSVDCVILSFFLSFCIARLPSIGCCITLCVEIAWFWFSQLGYCRSQCICECSYVTLNTAIFASTNVVNRPLLHVTYMIVVLPGHSPLLVRGDVSNWVDMRSAECGKSRSLLASLDCSFVPFLRSFLRSFLPSCWWEIDRWRYIDRWLLMSIFTVLQVANETHCIISPQLQYHIAGELIKSAGVVEVTLISEVRSDEVSIDWRDEPISEQASIECYLEATWHECVITLTALSLTVTLTSDSSGIVLLWRK